MTPQFILRQSLSRNPHCFRAHVVGQGYVNDGSIVESRPDFLRQYHRTALADIENLQWAPGYSERGYTDPARGVLLANWNHFPSRVTDVLERYGFEIEWEDEWVACDGCMKVVRTEPDSYVWEPSYKMYEEELLCHKCIEEETERKGE